MRISGTLWNVADSKGKMHIAGGHGHMGVHNVGWKPGTEDNHAYLKSAY